MLDNCMNQADAMHGTLHNIQAKLDAFKERHGAKINTKIERELKKIMQNTSMGMPLKDQAQKLPSDNFDTVSGWTLGDKTRLLAVLLDMTKDIIKTQIRSKIDELQRIKVKTLTIRCKISQLKKDIVVLKRKTLKNMGIQADQDFGWEEVALELNKYHSSSKYKAIWEMFFHPRINKKAWTREENQELQRLVAEKKMRDWESIAKTLNTGRTAYQCFVYFQTNVSHADCGRKWTQEEMDYLKLVVDLCKEDNYIPWGIVASLIGNHTKIECYNKYMRMIEARKGWFIPEEDTVILKFVNVYGTDFRKMSSFLTGRSAAQLRVRYNKLWKNHLSTIWSVEDDKKLLQIMTNQANFSTATSLFPGKDRENISSRYSTLVNWIERHPHRDIATAPRRNLLRIPLGKPISNLVKAVYALRATIHKPLQQSLKERNRKKLTGKSTGDTLHDFIMSAISAVDIKEQRGGDDGTKVQKAKVQDSFQILQGKDIASTTLGQSDLKNINRILDLLNAELADEKKLYNSNAGKSFEAKENKMPKVDQTRLHSKKKTTTKQDGNLFNFDPVNDGPKIGHGKFLPNFDTIRAEHRVLEELIKCSGKDTNETNINELVQRTLHVQEMLIQLQERFNSFFTSSSPDESSTHCRRNAKTDSRTSARPNAFVRCTCCEGAAFTAESIALKEKKGKDKGIGPDENA